VRLGLGLAALYLALGVVQQQRAAGVARQLAGERGHAVDELLVKPTIANLLLWRSVYVVDNRVYVDGIHVGLTARVYPGESLPLFDPDTALAGVAPDSRLWRDAARFREISQGMVVRHPDYPELLGDVRYAMLPTSAEPLWGILLDPRSPERTPPFVTNRALSEAGRERFLAMLLGRAIAPVMDD